MEKDGRLFGLEREQISLGYWVKREQETTAAAALSVGGAQPGPGGGGVGEPARGGGKCTFSLVDPPGFLLGSSRVPLASPPLPPMFQNPPKLRGPAQPLPDSEPPQRPRPLSPPLPRVPPEANPPKSPPPGPRHEQQAQWFTRRSARGMLLLACPEAVPGRRGR